MKQREDKWRLPFFCAMFRLCQILILDFEQLTEMKVVAKSSVLQETIGFPVFKP